ncbi:MAG: mechanosensitive ion channel domain-containing protein, partial [Bacteroidota bacterium]
MDIKKTEDSPTPPQVENLEKKQVLSTTYVILAVVSIAVYFLLQVRVFAVFGTYLALLSKVCLAVFFIALVLSLTQVAEALILKKSKSRSSGYNLVKLTRLLSYLILIFIVISFLFANWYTAIVSLGLISLILGFALQTPITSFIGWINILTRAPYHVGDRIQIDTFRGDVVEINYLDTTIWECGGDHLTNDVPSGRLIRFPNSMVLEYAIFNYSWQKFPYIWNEIPFH